MIELSRLATWGLLVGVGLGPALVGLVAWSPFLLADRLRDLFRALPPTRSLLVGYVLTGLSLWVPYLVGLFWALSAMADGDGGATATALLDVIIPVSFGYVVGLPMGAVLGLPRLGVDWDPTGYGASTWVLLIAGATWWSVLLAGPLFLLSLVFALPT